MMETEQTAGSYPAPGQVAVRTWLSSSARGAPRTPSDTTSRFQGDGVRYKAKLIGMDPVPDAQGDKMCWDSMMKLKGFEGAARKQGKHKLRVWLKVSSSGLKIVDERTGAVLYDHDKSRISSLTKDGSDPRALAYVYQHQGAYYLFYIKMANLADPVLVDINEVCQVMDQEKPEEPAEAPTQTSSLLVLNDSSAPPAEEPAVENGFSPCPDSSSGQLSQTSSSNELMEVFSIPMEEPMMPSQISSTSQPESPPPALSAPTLSTSQILSMFPTQPVGGSPYSSPPYSPTTMPWGQPRPVGNQWAGPAVAPWPTMPGSPAPWAPAGMVAPPGGIAAPPGGIAAPPAGGQIQAHSPQPGGVMMGGNAPASPTAVNGYPSPLNSQCAPTGATGPLQPVSPTLDDLFQ